MRFTKSRSNGVGRRGNRREVSRVGLEVLESRLLLSNTAIGTISNVQAGSNDYLLPDGAGNFYGYTQFGGANGFGSIYKVTPGSAPQVLVSLGGPDVGLGFGEIEGIAVDSAGNVFGIENDGPAVFELPNGASSVISVANNHSDLNSGLPIGGLTGIAIDSTGNIYLTDISGGANSQTSGSIDEIQAGGNSIAVVASFNGVVPSSHIVFNSNDDIYGIAGSNAFKVVRGSGIVTTLGTVPSNHQLNGYAPLAVDASGNLFGVEPTGGTQGVGAVYALYAGDSTFTTVASFTGASGQGQYPSGIVLDSGLLIGITASGGANQHGTLYSIPVSGVSNGNAGITTLTSFDSTDAKPFGNIVLVNGTVYGVTADDAPSVPNQVVFEATLGQDSSGGGGGGGSLSTSVTKNTLPTTVVAGGTSKGTVTVSLTNNSGATYAEKTKVQIYASLDGSVDGSSILLGTTTVSKLTVKDGKAVPVAVSIKAIPSDLAGTYTLFTQVTDASGNVTTSTTGPTEVVAAAVVSLSETVTSTLASAMVSDETTKGNIVVTVTNNGNTMSKGTTLIEVTASTMAGVVGTEIATWSKSLTIAPGKSTKVTIAVKDLPALTDGSYYFVTETTDPFAAGTSVATTANTAVIAAPFVSFAGTLGAVKKVTAGDTLTLTNNGNIESSVAFSETFSFSSDALGTQQAGGSGTTSSKTIRIAAGKSMKIHLSQWAKLTAGLVKGDSYYLTVTLSDFGGQTIFAVSSTNFVF